MKDFAMSKKQKRTRSESSSSHYSISDNGSPEQKVQKKERSQEYSHRHSKHVKRLHKNHKHFRLDRSSSNDNREKYRSLEKEKKFHSRDVSPAVKVKEEPLSEEERDYKNKHRLNNQTRSNVNPSYKNHSKHDRESKRPSRHASLKSDIDRSRPMKEEPTSEPEWGKKDIKKEKREPQNNAKPDFGLSGKLTEDANTFNGVVIKYSEPPEARKPKRRWRLYPFKGETSLPVLHIHRQSAYLLGRDRKVADIPIDHPSCSKQHAALQYRLVPFTRSDGSKGRQIKLYVIDLESANGTYLNNQKIDPKKYYELKERDVVKFGYSSREYVLLHEHSKGSENDDDFMDDDLLN